MGCIVEKIRTMKVHCGIWIHGELHCIKEGWINVVQADDSGIIITTNAFVSMIAVWSNVWHVTFKSVILYRSDQRWKLIMAYLFFSPTFLLLSNI